MRNLLRKVKVLAARVLWIIAHFLLKLSARLLGVEALESPQAGAVTVRALRPRLLQVKLANLKPRFMHPHLLNLSSLVGHMVRPKLRDPLRALRT